MSVTTRPTTPNIRHAKWPNLYVNTCKRQATKNNYFVLYILSIVYPCMIVDAAHFSDGEFEEDIDGATASCREHKVLIVIHSWLFYSTLSPNISIIEGVWEVRPFIYLFFLKTTTKKPITHWVAGPPSCRWAGGRRPLRPRARSARSHGNHHPRWPATWTQQSYL